MLIICHMTQSLKEDGSHNAGIAQQSNTVNTIIPIEPGTKAAGVER